MPDEAKLHADKAKGAEAEALLRNELLTGAFKVLETDYVRAWAGTQPHEREARESFWKSLQILGDVERHLKLAIQNGKLAEAQLKELALKFRPTKAA